MSVDQRAAAAMNTCQDSNDSPLKRANPAGQRGQRLYPARSNRIYWHLTCLRREIGEIIQQHIAGRGLECMADYGCGNMPYRPIFQEHVPRYIGCDFPGNEMADQTLDDVARMPLDAGSIDAVLSTQVLEHVSDPQAYLGECHRVLKENGLLILSTHGVWKYHPDPCDYWRWTSAGLQRLLTQSGFSIVRFRGLMGPAATGLQIWQDAVLRRVPKMFRGVFTTLVQMMIQRADRKCPDSIRDRDACVFMLVARKSYSADVV